MTTWAESCPHSHESAEFDLVVVGSGCAGLCTALFAALRKLRVLVVEKSQWVGGTSALSAGALWIPNTRHAAKGTDSPEQAARYLDASVGSGSRASLRAAFLAFGPQAVEVLERNTEVRLRAFAHHPDYLSDLPGSTTQGRALECLPFDGRLLGADFARLRPPIPEFTVLGGMMVDRVDIGHLLNLTRSFAALRHTVRLVARFVVDRLRYPRGTRLVLGNALMGRLFHSLRQRNVPVWTEAPAIRLLYEAGRVAGVVVRCQGKDIALKTRMGVVLAGGGFNDNASWRARWLPHIVTNTPRAGTASGELLEEVVQLGASLGVSRDDLGTADRSSAFWAPVSVRRRDDGSIAVFPHFVLDRAKPGTLIVDAHGKRFVNESSSYHLFGEALIAHARDQGVPGYAWLIADELAVRRYGLGMVRPGSARLARFLRQGYLVRADSCEGLAHAISVPAHVLSDTVERFNAHAERGVDEDFGRGCNAYQRNLGDPAHGPNPTLRPLVAGTWFALRLEVGDIACRRGLLTDENARVLRQDDGLPIDGVYAVGNDMHSIMGSAYPGPGINLGPAVAFAYAAVQAMTTQATQFSSTSKPVEAFACSSS